MILAVIPSRYGSSRFSGKPLVDILGKTMIRRVYERVSQAKKIGPIYVATDDERIYEHVHSFGGKALMTSSQHQNGTDRCREALELIREENPRVNFTHVINIQGDEPLIEPAQVDEIASLLNEEVELATLVTPAESTKQLFSPSKVKVTMNTRGEALYFSRSPIPFIRNEEQKNWLNSFKFFCHVGIYAYRCDILEKISQLEVSSLETAESLEQLRWLENGYRIRCGLTKYSTIGVDTPADVEAIIALLKEGK